MQGARTYYGTLRIESADAANSPCDFAVILDVQSSGAMVTPQLDQAGLIFIANPNQLQGSQTVTLSADTSTPLPFQASAAAADGAGWLAVDPTTGTVSTSEPAQTSVSFDATGLAPGVYRGGVSYALSSAAVRTVNVTLIVVNPASASASQPSSRAAGSRSAGCVPTQLIATQVGLAHNFQQTAGWPVGLAIKLLNDCGELVSAARVAVTFNNGDAPIELLPIDNVSGLYVGTWVPRGVSPQVTATATASLDGLPAASTSITGQVLSGSAPLIDVNGVQSQFNQTAGVPLAPGSLIIIRGRNLAAELLSVSDTPWPFSLGDTVVTIGGLAIPLAEVAPDHIIALVPFELPAGSSYEVHVQTGDAVSAAEPIDLAEAAPAILTDESGLPLARHMDFSLVTADSPAQPGEEILFYLTGMGAAETTVASGAVLTEPSALLHPPAATMNGVESQLGYTAMMAGSVGLYEVHIFVPAAVTGDSAEVVVTQTAVSSNVVKLPLRQLAYQPGAVPADDQSARTSRGRAIRQTAGARAPLLSTVRRAAATARTDITSSIGSPITKTGAPARPRSQLSLIRQSACG